MRECASSGLGLVKEYTETEGYAWTIYGSWLLTHPQKKHVPVHGASVCEIEIQAYLWRKDRFVCVFRCDLSLQLGSQLHYTRFGTIGTKISFWVPAHMGTGVEMGLANVKMQKCWLVRISVKPSSESPHGYANQYRSSASPIYNAQCTKTKTRCPCWPIIGRRALLRSIKALIRGRFWFDSLGVFNPRAAGDGKKLFFFKKCAEVKSFLVLIS